jgi:hypothetical protein
MIIQDICSINGLSEFFPSFGIAFLFAAFAILFASNFHGVHIGSHRNKAADSKGHRMRLKSSSAGSRLWLFLRRRKKRLCAGAVGVKITLDRRGNTL